MRMLTLVRDRFSVPLILCLVAVLALAQTACSIKLVADYDQTSVDQLLATYAKVDGLYDRMAETPPEKRSYDAFKSEWGGIETDLRTFSLRQGLRPLNEESTKIVELLLDNWQRERAAHKRRSESDASPAKAYPDAKLALDRDQFETWFRTAMAAERFKK